MHVQVRAFGHVDQEGVELQRAGLVGGGKSGGGPALRGGGRGDVAGGGGRLRGGGSGEK